MPYNFVTTMLNTPTLISGSDNETTIQDVSQHSSNATLYSPLQDDCIEVVFSQMEFLPWDNPNNIVSAEVEAIVHKLKHNLLFVLFLIGGPANVINMAVFYKQGLKDRVNLCLFALAFADELSLLWPMVYHGEQLYLQFTTGEKFGPVTTALTNSNLTFIAGFCFISPILSAIIATERCLCVFNPLRFQGLLRSKTMAIIIGVVFVVVLSLLIIVFFRYHISCVYDPTTGISIMAGVEGTFYQAHKELIDGLDSYVFGVGLPWIEMIVVITTTIMTIVKLRQIVTWRSETTTTVSAREVALTKMLVGNSILFIACIFPASLIRSSWVLFPEMNAGRRHQNLFLCSLSVTEMCTFINATFNFFVYYAMGSRYRETFWALLHRNRNKV